MRDQSPTSQCLFCWALACLFFPSIDFTFYYNLCCYFRHFEWRYFESLMGKLVSKCTHNITSCRSDLECSLHAALWNHVSCGMGSHQLLWLERDSARAWGLDSNGMPSTTISSYLFSWIRISFRAQLDFIYRSPFMSIFWNVGLWSLRSISVRHRTQFGVTMFLFWIYGRWKVKWSSWA